MNVTAFSPDEVEGLFKRAKSAKRVPRDTPQKWSISKKDPMRLLKIFRTLNIKEGYVLRAYQYRSGNNGNGIIYAMPVDVPFPELDEFEEPTRPEGSFEDVMKAIDGDGSPLSYLSASVFGREAREFGAMWHGVAWDSHYILFQGPPLPDTIQADVKNITESRWDPDDWEWKEESPREWRPTVSIDDDGIVVSFHSYSGLGRCAIYHHVDVYKDDSYRFTRKDSILAEGPGGYIH